MHTFKSQWGSRETQQINKYQGGVATDSINRKQERKAKRDVGMACQKVHSTQTRKFKSDGKYIKPNSYIFALL